MTNFERIKAMSVEEFIEAFRRDGLCSYIQDYDVGWCATRGACTNCVKEWLESEVQE